MSLKRRQKKTVARFAWLKPAVAALSVCAFIGGAAVGYVWQKKQNVGIYDRIAERQRELHDLEETHAELMKEHDRLLNPLVLEKMVQRFGLNLRMPDPDQIIRLPEPEANEQTADSQKQYARR